MILLRYFLWLISFLVFGAGVFFLWSTIVEFRPEKEIVLSTSEKVEAISGPSIFSVLTWNIGYGGLGSNMDFFYDGGTRMRDSKENTLKNIEAIRSFLKANDTLDFLLIQEIDTLCKRTYRINEMDYLQSALGSFEGYLAINYQSDFIPVPLTSSMGKVNSGIATFTKHKTKTVVRYSYPGGFSWPKRLFMPKRCFLETRYNLSNGKELILINTHNTAFGDSTMLNDEINFLQDHVILEYNNGNYILIGGDWNQSPAGFVPEFSCPVEKENMVYLPETFLHNWNIAYCNDIPTNREVKAAYDKGKTLTTTIDFFIASPNIEIQSEKVIDLDFKNTDHQPVIVTFKLIN